MRVSIERVRPEPATELVEVVTPRTNLATIGAAENLLAAISVAEPFSLEIAATGRVRRFLARAGSPTMRRHLEDQLGVAYPQADLRPADRDPAERGADEQAAGCAFRLRAAPYLPLRTFEDAEVDATRRAQADPVLGILGALGDLPDGWRAVSQLVLRPAPEDWARDYLRLAVESPVARERASERYDTSLTQVWLMGGLLVAGLTAYQAYQWYLDEEWLSLGLLAGGVAAGLTGLFALLRRLNRKEVYDPRLVREKLDRVAFLAQLRLAVFAPPDAPPAAVAERLVRAAAAYRQFGLAAGNGLEPRPLDLRGRDLRVLAPLPSWRAAAVLNLRELAGLWHPPQAGADVPLLERTTARRILPLPDAVACGCRIGAESHQGREVVVHLSEELLRRHLLLVAKTRRGKSSLLLRLSQHLMADPDRTLVLVDPHRDLAEAALGLVPPARRGAVVYLDAANQDRPFGLNLIDVGLGWDRDQAVESTLAVFKRQFDNFWGPRMANAFRWALRTLYDANLARAKQLGGRERQHTVLEVPAVLNAAAFRRLVRSASADPFVKHWWGEYDELGRPMQIETANPVLTKVYRFAASRISRDIVGQPCSTIDPAGWLRDAAIVIVSTAKGTVGEDTAGLVGATLINLVGLLVANQAGLPKEERRALTLVVDEFQSMPGADYELVLAELAKFGGNLILATQSLARLEALDRTHERALRDTVFANIDGLFAFNVSAEDARVLVRELGPEVDEADLVSLGDHRCYARITCGGERLPAFSLLLDPPLAPDPALRAQLAAASAKRYGRPYEEAERQVARALRAVENARQQAVAAAKKAQKEKADKGAVGKTGGGGSAGSGGNGVPKELVARNEYRGDPERRSAEEQARALETIEQLSLLDAEASEAAAADDGEASPSESEDESDGEGEL